MDMEVAVNVFLPKPTQLIPDDGLLAWLNDTLQTSFTNAEQLCGGGAFCQLMNWLFPKSIDLSSVQFLCNNMVDAIPNYRLLNAAFKKVGVLRCIPIEELIKKDTAWFLAFLYWFKAFFERNLHQDRKYNPLEARGGQSMVPAYSEPKPQKDKLIENSPDVIVVISDEDDDVMDLTAEEETETQKTTVEEDSKDKRVTQAVAAMQKGSGRSDDTLLRFVKRYRHTSGDSQVSGPILSPNHPTDIVMACSRVPYSLYLYVGVELGGGQNTSVVLVGYFDQSSGVSVVKPLLTLQLSVDAVDKPQTTADAVPNAAAADARLLIEKLKKCGLLLSKVVTFYCNAPHPGVSRVFVSMLQAYNPKLMSLCGLPDVAERACQAGLLASFSCVVDLVRDIHDLLHTYPPVSDDLKGLFLEPYNPSRPVQVLFTTHSVQRIASSWRPLVDYLKSLKQADERIRTQLMDHKVKLRFIFLSHMLEPLQALQKLQECGTSVVAEVQLTAMLVRFYATNLLRPSVAEHFFTMRDVRVLQDGTKLLPITEVQVGARAREFLWATAVVDLGEQERRDFLKDAATFYKAALECLVESLPRHLGEVVLTNIYTVLKHSGSIRGNTLSRNVLYELGFQLGLFKCGLSEKHQLAYDYHKLIKTVKGEHGWQKILDATRPHSALRMLFLTVLALPSSLGRTQVFDKVFKRAPPPSKLIPAALSQFRCLAEEPLISKLRNSVQVVRSDKKNQEALSEDGDCVEVAKASFHLLSQASSRVEDSDYTDNSSDVVDTTEVFETSPSASPMKTASERTPQSAFVEVLVDRDDGGISTSTPPNSGQLLHVIGELVWGQVDGFSPWPAIIRCSGGEQLPDTGMVEWYGQNMSSQVSLKALKPFAAFAQHFCSNSFAILITYREALFTSLQEAALRCKKDFSEFVGDRDELLKHMLDWALGGFQPTGPDGLKPTDVPNDVTQRGKRAKPLSSSGPRSRTSNTIRTKPTEKSVSDRKLSRNSKEKLSPGSGGESASEEGFDSAERSTKRVHGGGEGERDDWGGQWEKERGKGKGGKAQKKKSSPFDGFDDDMSPDFLPYKKKTINKPYNKVNQTTSAYTQPDQELRENIIRTIMEKKLDIEGFCLCCGTKDVDIFHPLFKGSLCSMCKDNLKETLYCFDDDGYQSYCTICCYGLEVLLCGNDSCGRCYCTDCLNILVGPGTFDSLKAVDPWICYLCQPHKPHGALIPREDWSIRVQELFANTSAMEFEPHRVYPSIPANLRRPVRVLSLFDGIATGYFVLKELGFKVEAYVASEICEDSLAVATINHDGKIHHVGDARFITHEHINEWGPFDLLIGGSPCNDLSIVNPLRKGVYEGTGRLFFEYYRILQLLKPKEEDPRPFFWLFENVVFMNTHDKVNICRFLECNPVLVNAVNVSPAHRARCFWGNIPGMSRPITASQNDKLNLQDCLEIGRKARVSKVRTITTNPNSLKQGKGVNSLLPVLHNGKEDNLWITELERIFGFPKHYTDVRNMNRQQRQKVLGKAWSVPVIRHLFAPLKDYFACEELPPLTTSNSSPSPSSPASPELEQLR
uniref:uncharacterized protein LOC120829486 isoform X2 n=1 Tax=Gasterosteus aculeatus aculeatus TaxID=481459 RepID=UPI001A994E00|nr:uncharacterized protein LOC120829486 isoform X2 [Gasterosteus aculeatus aculeatus]